MPLSAKSRSPVAGSIAMLAAFLNPLAILVSPESTGVPPFSWRVTM